MKKLFLFIIVLGVLTGCGTTAKFVYPAKGKNLISFKDGPAYQKKIAVVPFDEMRGDENQAGSYFLYLIPLMPFGWGEYERPDAATMFNTVREFDFDPSEDLAKAAAYSFRKSNLFEDAFFTYGGDKDKADFLFKGEIISTEYRGSIWSYGLSVYGPLLWFIGLPAGRSHNDLTLYLQMEDLHTGNLVWEKRYEKTNIIIQGFYYNWGHDVKYYSNLMQEIMNDAIEDINRQMQKRGS